MKRLTMLICLSLAIGLLLCGCGGGPGGGPPPEPPLTPEQIAQIEATSQDINNVLLQADDPFSPEALEAAKQAALTQLAVEQAAVAEDSLVVKYKDGGFEVWQGDIPKITPPADIAELQELTRSVLANASLTRAPVGTRQAVLIDAVYEDNPTFDHIEIVYDTIEQILRVKGFSDVKRLNGPEASITNLKELSGCSVLVMIGHGGWSFVLLPFSFPYSVQTGETWREELYDRAWADVLVIKMRVPWGEGNKETRESNLRAFAATTGAFWNHYYKRNHFNNGLFLNLACSGSRYERFRNELFEVGIKGYTGWSEEQGIATFTAWLMLAIMAEEKTLQQAYDELPNSWKHQDLSDENRTWGVDLQIFGKDDGLNLTLGGGPIPEGPEITITSPENGSTTTERTITVQGKITPWEYGWPEARAHGQLHLAGMAAISVNGQSSGLPVDRGGNFSHAVELRDGENIIRVSAITIAKSSKEIRVIGDFSSSGGDVEPARGKIAFISDRDGNREIYVMNEDGTGQTNLSNNAADDWWTPAWSPDGTKIAFASNRDGNYEIYVLNADGTGPTRLTNNPAWDYWPDWSPDGTKIAFESTRDGNREIYVMNADGTGQTRLTNNPNWDEVPVWSPDGAKIAFQSDRDRVVDFDIYVMNADGTGQTNLTNNPAWDCKPAWSPDGAKIAFSSDRDGNDEIYVMKADGTGLTRLTNNPTIDRHPAWSPDGTKIIFMSDRDGSAEIYVMNADGSGLTRLTNNRAWDDGPAWSPAL